jgi:hypothetical protein
MEQPNYRTLLDEYLAFGYFRFLFLFFRIDFLPDQNLRLTPMIIVMGNE